MKKKSPTDAELTQLALDILTGKAFTDRSVRSANDLRMVFMPLIFLDKKGLAALRKQKPFLFYEYVANAGPVSCNGCPTFFSMRFIAGRNKKRFERIFKVVEKKYRAITAETTPKNSA